MRNSHDLSSLSFNDTARSLSSRPIAIVSAIIVITSGSLRRDLAGIG